ncbi:hypothetical protein Tco_0291859 [Tanacetum coccineum]
MPRTRGNHDDEAGSSRPKRTREFETVKEGVVENEIEEMFKIKLVEMGGDQEILSSKAWRRAFDINEQIYVELCYKVYSTYEFNELVQDDELWSKVGEEGFKTYFHGGLCSDEHFSAREHWLRISKEGDLHLSRSHVSIIRKPILRVLQKMISHVDEKERSWESEREHDLLWALDMFTLRELIGLKGRLITEAPMPGAPRIAMPVPLRPFMQDLYDRMGNMEIRQGVWSRGWLYKGRQKSVGIVYSKLFLSTWLEFTIFHFRELITYLGIISSNISSIINSTMQQHAIKDMMKVSAKE